MKDHEYEFTAKVWIWPGPSTWYFVSLPKDMSEEMSKAYEHLKAGFGSLAVDVYYKNLKWKTSIFPERQKGNYFLPLKKEIRKKGDIQDSDEITLTIVIRT